MSKLHCRLSDRTETLGAQHILSTHKTSKGVIAYLRCPDGGTVVADYSVIDPWNWRNIAPRDPEQQAA